LAVEVGVKEVESCCPAPTPSIVPLAGAYVEVPPTFTVEFNCVALSAVPELMSAGFAQVMSGVAFSTVIATDAFAEL
jgi:hypothetical protein